MDIYVLSDVHLEFYTSLEKVLSERNIKYMISRYLSSGKNRIDSVLVLAGDIGNPYNNRGHTNTLYIDFLKQMKTIFNHVLLIAGNHEYYGSHGIKNTDLMIEYICKTIGIIFLQRTVWVHPTRDICFGGCTLWSNISVDAMNKLNDRNYVYNTHDEVINMHRNDVQWIEQLLYDVKMPLVVITHHMPSDQCIHNIYKGKNADNSGYSTNLEYLLQKPITTWICGHSHVQTDIIINAIQIISNPIGYKHELAMHKCNVFEPIRVFK